MFDHLHYVPILKSKRAEFSALSQLSTELKAKLTPMIEVIPVPWDFVAERPKKSLKTHVDVTIGYIVKSWPDDYPMFLDFTFVASRNEVVEGKHSLIYCLETLHTYNKKIVPVTGLDLDENFQNALQTILRRDKGGLCFRIQQDDLDDFDNLSDSLNDLLQQFQMVRKKCDIILDFKALPLQKVSEPAAYISNVLRAFPNVTEWRTLTVVATNFPKILGMTVDSDELIPREEYFLWSNIVERNDIPRLPSFGDYSIQHPDMSDLDYRKIKIPVNLRYATANHWLIYKGREKNRHGHQQFNRICRDLIQRHEYYGPDYSEGDYYIDCCARNTEGPGTPEIWRRVGFNHHMTLVVRQLANFDES